MNTFRKSQLQWLLVLAWGGLSAQHVHASESAYPAQSQAAMQQPIPMQPPSSLVRPALDSVAHAGSSVDLNHWKGSGAAREEVDANLASMQKDLETTLPPLLSAADAAPGSAAASLPVLLNLDALYSVLLRVTIASRTGAPRDQNTALEQAAAILDSARRDLGEAVLGNVQVIEKRNADLQAAAQQQADTPNPTPSTASAPAAAKPNPPATKKKKRPTPAKPTSTTPASPVTQPAH